MSMTVDNSLLNARSYMIESDLTNMKKVRYGDESSSVKTVTTSDSTVISYSDAVKSLDETVLVLQEDISSTIPELAQAAVSSENIDSDTLKKAADVLQQLIALLEQTETSNESTESDTTQTIVDTKTNESSYVSIKEQAFAALYAQLLELFSDLNVASAQISATNIEMAYSLAESSASSTISSAESQKTQAIVSAVTTLGVAGAGLAMSMKGIKQQQTALQQSKVSNNLNSVNDNLNNSILNGSNVNSSVSSTTKNTVGNSIINNNSTISSVNSYEAEMLKLAGIKNTNTGHIVGTLGATVGAMVSSGYTVEAATQSASAAVDQAAKDGVMEAEAKNRENQNAIRTALQGMLDMIYQTLDKTNSTVNQVSQLIKA